MTTITLPNYSYGQDCFEDIPKVLSNYQVKTIALIGGEKALASSEKEVRQILTAAGYQITGSFIYGKDATQTNIDRLCQTSDIARADMIFGFGGGRALDTIKMVAYHLKKPLFTFPTICSNCSASTAITAIYKEDGSLDYYGYPEAPLHIFINTRIIAQAPAKYFWAGVADGISKAPEVERAIKEDRARGKVLSHTALLGQAVARSSEDAFYRYGKEGLEAVKQQKVNQAVEEIALAIIISTGYASNLVNQPDFYYNSAHAHAFYNGSMAVQRDGEYLHGIVVAFGVMILHAYYDEVEQLAKVARFNRDMGFPTKLADIGLQESDLPTIMEVVLQTNEHRHLNFDPHRFRQAILTADAYGKTLH